MGRCLYRPQILGVGIAWSRGGRKVGEGERKPVLGLRGEGAPLPSLPGH